MKTGYGAAHGRFFQKPDKSGLAWNKYTGGLVWKYFSPQQIVGGVSAEIEFQQRGYSLYDGRVAYPSPFDSGRRVISDTTSYQVRSRSLNSITVPLIWQPHLYMMNRQVRFFLSAGITVSYNTGMGDKLTTTDYKWNRADRTQTVVAITAPYKMQTARDVRWAYGWLGGVGLSVLVNRWEIFAEGRYYYGMSDILRTKTKYLFNEENSIRSELDNIYITLGLTLRLGKGDILAPPLRRRQARPADDSNFRNIKTGR